MSRPLAASSLQSETLALGNGDAGAATVTSTGSILTGFAGIQAASLASNGDAGAVTVTSTGNVSTGSQGIAAFSETIAGGNAGTVAVTSLGNVTTGYGSQGIVAGSLGLGGGASAMTVTRSGHPCPELCHPCRRSHHGHQPWQCRCDRHQLCRHNSFGNASGNISVNVLGGTVTGGSSSGIGVELIDGACGVLQTHQRRRPLGRRLLGFRPPKLLRCARRELSARRGWRAPAHACGRRFRLVWHHACFDSSTRTRVMGY